MKRKNFGIKFIKLFLFVVTLLWTITGLRAQTNDDCLACHEDKTLTKVRDKKTVSLYIDKNIIGKSVHGKRKCIDCHKDAAVADFPHPENLNPVNCGSCHTNQLAQFNASIHGKAFNANQPYAPNCKECHGKHDVISRTNPISRTYKMNIPVLCGTCHKEDAPIGRLYKITEHNIVENYSQGTHGIGLFKKGLTVTATCNDCHGNHLILPLKDSKSSIAPNNIASTCMKCHARIESVHKKVIKSELWEKQKGIVPACSDCHPPHKVKIENIVTNISDQKCITCHVDGDAFKTVNGKKISLKVDRKEITNSAHIKISCTKCHADVSLQLARPCEKIKKVDCSNCHTEVAAVYFNSGHGKAVLSGNNNAPSCSTCHGTHQIKPKKDDTSPTYRGNVPSLCGKCHNKSGKAFGNTVLKEVNAYFNYSTSVHGKGLVEKGLLSSAICTDCHTSHNIQKDTVVSSSISRQNIALTCAGCHKSIYLDYMQSEHSLQNDKGKLKYPTCIDCHTAHVISDVDKDKFMSEITMQCGKCHEKLAATYLETYHGKAYQLGYLKTARCSDCHGAHKILKVSNPNSSVSPKNIVATCSKCHTNANLRFTGYLTHSTHKDKPILSYVFWAMTSLLIGVFLVFGIHTLMWLPRSLKERKKKRHVKPTGKATYFRRFTSSQRVTHVFVIISFLLLAFTGMLLKFAHMDWANHLANLIGGVRTAGKIHRFGAIITFGYFGFHLFSLIRTKILKDIPFMDFIFGKNSLMFNKQDLFDVGATLKWFVGKGERPKYGRWTYWEKFDYMAVFWGVAVIGFSGLILWFPEVFTKIFPGWVINVATIIHSDEALLAVGFIFTIHFFNTHMRPESFPMDTVIFTGHVPIEEYEEDRQREISELKEDGKLENSVVEKEISLSWIKFVKIFGYTALFTGIILVILIIFSMIFGKY